MSNKIADKELDRQLSYSNKFLPDNKILTSNQSIMAKNFQESDYYAVSNAFVVGLQPMTAAECKLLRLILSQYYHENLSTKVDENNYIFHPFKIHSSVLAELMNIKNKNYYRNLQSAARSLMDRKMFINSDENWEIYNIMSYVAYEKGFFTFKLNTDIAQFVTGLEEYFTIYNLTSSLVFENKYALRIYEAIKSLVDKTPCYTQAYRNKAPFTVEFTVEELRTITATINKYPLSKAFDFKKKVILDPLEEINSSTDITVEYINASQLRKTETIRFLIQRHEQDEPINEQAISIAEIMASTDVLSLNYITTLFSNCNRKYEEQHIEELFKLYKTKETFDKDFNYALSHAKFSLSSYMIKIITEKIKNSEEDPLVDEAEKIYERVVDKWNKIAESNAGEGIKPLKYRTEKTLRLLSKLLENNITENEIYKNIEKANKAQYFLNHHNTFPYFLNYENFKKIANGDEDYDSKAKKAEKVTVEPIDDKRKQVYQEISKENEFAKDLWLEYENKDDEKQA